MDTLDENRGIVEGVLEGHVAADVSLRPLEKHPNDRYGVVYAFDLTPCCFPLNCNEWINRETPGLFLRCFFGPVRGGESHDRVVSCIGPINYALPTGCFAVDDRDGEVLYKNGFYFGEARLDESLVAVFFESSFEFVARHWKEILASIYGPEFRHDHK